MIRYFLAKGDRAKDAVIVEGLDHVTCSNPPPRVNIATLDMKTYCTACKRGGYIAPRGPRQPGTAPNGKQWALSGDINVCDCYPPPVFYAERGMRMLFSDAEIATFSGEPAATSHLSLMSSDAPALDEQYVLRDATGRPLARVRYRVRTQSGQTFDGTTDLAGHTQHVTTSNAENLRLYVYREHV